MKRFFLSIIGIVLFLLCLSAVAGADTEIGGSITGDTTWNLAGSPYIVTSDVTVEAGVTLTVQAGVKVKFNSGLALDISGTLNVSGTGTNLVIFTSNQSNPLTGDWGGIRFYDNSAGNMSNCVVEYADTGIYINQRTSPHITDCTVRYNKTGIKPDSWGSRIPQPVVNNCAIYENTDYNYYCDVQNTAILDVKNNWWGTDNPSEISQGIYDFGDHYNHGVADFSSFLDSENGSPVTEAAGGETYLIGGTVSDLTLNGSYIVPSYFHVRSGHTATIKPGTILKFMSGAYFSVFGTLEAGDSSGSPVVFTSAQGTPAPKDWGGIRFYDSSAGNMISCVVEYADTGIYLNQRTSPQITGCTVRYNITGIKPDSWGSNIPQPVVNSCAIYENTDYNYYCDVQNTTTLDATNNWWGTDNQTEIAETIYDYYDNSNVGIVNFEGWVNVFTNFTAYPKTGKAPLTVQFTDQSVGSPTSWQWDFNNDGIIDSTEQYPTYTYNTIGVYSVKLIAGNADATDEELKTDYINVFDLKADFTVHPTSGTFPITVRFTDKTIGGPVTWQWDFDNDGVVDSTEQNPTYTYNKKGTYSVKLTVSNADATDEELKTEYIKVIPSTVLTAYFIADKTTGNAQLEVKFTDRSTGSPASWQWDFNNDGIIDSTDQNPTYTYNTAGVYSVKLIISDGSATDEELKENYIKVSDSDLLADLQVTDVQISDKAYAGQSFQVNWTVKNSGSSATSESSWT